LDDMYGRILAETMPEDKHDEAIPVFLCDGANYCIIGATSHDCVDRYEIALSTRG